ncbi:winged helix-turn-helix transcriptional regulator [Candidatus Gottesmanbacteria bacterium]|nr:winged helix-turn-helix transcriptional regulator [Candidatus Gottesmanbacteria bacterium]
MPDDRGFEIRDLRNGDWYWIHKTVIQRYMPLIGATGVIVYSFLASLANSKQACYPSQKYIADNLGYSRATVNKAIKRLEENRLIKIERRSRYHCVYSLLKVRCQPRETQMSTLGNSDVKYFDTNNNKRTINIKNIVMDNLKNDNSNGFRPETREELLALDLAEGLNDHRNLPLYIVYARTYPEQLLRRVLGVVKEIPDNKIRKSRGALFTYIIKKHGQRNTEDHRA